MGVYLRCCVLVSLSFWRYLRLGHLKDLQPQTGWGFHRKKVERCEDCDLRGDLDLLGRPRFEALGRVKSCIGCHGSATVPREKTRDPMWTGKS